jgi:hypothetical protein
MMKANCGIEFTARANAVHGWTDSSGAWSMVFR